MSNELTAAPTLPPGNPEEQVETILSRSDAREFTQALEAPTVYRLVQDAGWDSAQELVPLLAQDQLAVCLDLDCWDRHRFLPARVAPWLAALVSGADDATFRERCRQLDAEVLALFFKEHLLVDHYGEEGDLPPSLVEYDVEPSPDRVYALAYVGDDAVNALLRATIARLYEVDIVLGWTLLEAARWELKSTMEEEALRWRTSRLEEWGFVDMDEALRIYRPLDGPTYRDKLERSALSPKRVPQTAHTHLPALLDSDPAAGESFVARAIACLDAGDARTVRAEFVALQNRAAIAEGIDPGDRADVRILTERTNGYLSIGLEFLARGDVERAADVLRAAPLRDAFRVGFTTVDRLRDTVQTLRRRPTLSLIDGERFSLLRPADAALCEALQNVRPLYASTQGERRPFSEQSEVDDAARRLALIAFKQLWLFGVQRVTPDGIARNVASAQWSNDPSSLAFDSFFASAVACVVVGEPPAVYLPGDKLRELPIRLRERAWADDPIAMFEPLIGPALESLGGAARLMTTWLDATLAELVDEVSEVLEPDPALLGSLLVVGR